jgi:hypothetical protein
MVGVTNPKTRKHRRESPQSRCSCCRLLRRSASGGGRQCGPRRPLCLPPLRSHLASSSPARLWLARFSCFVDPAPGHISTAPLPGVPSRRGGVGGGRAVAGWRLWPGSSLPKIRLRNLGSPTASPAHGDSGNGSNDFPPPPPNRKKPKESSPSRCCRCWASVCRRKMSMRRREGASGNRPEQNRVRRRPERHSQ